jgi:hypothetical protein
MTFLFFFYVNPTAIKWNLIEENKGERGRKNEKKRWEIKWQMHN